MEYSPLKTFNPSIDDVTIKSSIWLSSRLMPAKGHTKISFPHFRIVGNTAMRTGDFSDFNTAALLGINDSNSVINFESSAGSLAWKGCWSINSNAVIGRGHATLGLICPLSTFNAGYRYKRGWRPSRVN